MEIVDADGLPLAVTTGNVLRPSTSLAISMRLGPCKDVVKAAESLKEIHEKTHLTMQRYQMKLISATTSDLGHWKGWNAPMLEGFSREAIGQAAEKFFGSKNLNMAEGGSIPTMNLLQNLWLKAQFLVTGVRFVV